MRKIHIVAYYKGVDPKYLNEEIEKLAAKHGNIVEASLCELDNKVILTAHTESLQDNPEAPAHPEGTLTPILDAVNVVRTQLLNLDAIEPTQPITNGTVLRPEELSRFHIQQIKAKWEEKLDAVQAKVAALTEGTHLLIRKRTKQILYRGTIEQDAARYSDELLKAAGAYIAKVHRLTNDPSLVSTPVSWPDTWGKFKHDPDPIENLINAAACLVAEADRRHYLKQHGKE